MHALGLQPFVHPSQLFHSISPHNQKAENTPLKGSVPDLTESESLASADEARWKEAISNAQGKLELSSLGPILTIFSALEKTEWPKLLNLNIIDVYSWA